MGSTNQALTAHFLCGNYEASGAEHRDRPAPRAAIFDEMKSWRHPGGKLREIGANKLDDSELLAVLISTGTRGRPAETIARELIERFGSMAGLANQPLEALLSIKGLGDVKILRIAAALELARRTANEIIRERERQTK